MRESKRIRPDSKGEAGAHRYDGCELELAADLANSGEKSLVPEGTGERGKCARRERRSRRVRGRSRGRQGLAREVRKATSARARRKGRCARFRDEGPDMRGPSVGGRGPLSRGSALAEREGGVRRVRALSGPRVGLLGWPGWGWVGPVGSFFFFFFVLFFFFLLFSVLYLYLIFLHPFLLQKFSKNIFE